MKTHAISANIIQLNKIVFFAFGNILDYELAAI